MDKKVLFSVKMNKSNTYKKDFLIHKFNKYIDLPNSDILEIGIGNGRFGHLLGGEVLHYYGIDIDKEYVRIAKSNIPKGAKVTYKIGDAEKIPFEKKFDVIFYAQSWHFIKDFQKALKEVKRILNPNGIIAIIEPTKNSKKWASPKLRKDSPEFNKDLYQKKLNSLNRGRRAILGQSTFIIIEDEYIEKMTSQFYILRNKE
jgi:ubiquinone/menaquinone biosynthesis C-methylase UbiE